MNISLNTYTKLLGLYLFTLVFFYPYGFTFGTNNFRISDILTILLISIGFLLILKNTQVQKRIVKIWFIIPFFALEVMLHFVGVMQYPNESIMSSARIMFLYLPMLFIFLMYRERELNHLSGVIDKSLKVSLTLTFIYSMIQVGVVYGYIPYSFLIEQYIVNLAVDPHFKIMDGTRASGFFNGSIGLSLFGIIAFSYFLPKLMFDYKKANFIYTLFAALIVVFSSTRVALIIMMIIFVFNLFFIPSPLKNKVRLMFSATISLVVMAVILNVTIGLNDIFFRFNRLGNGLENDYSFTHRTEHLWPNVINSVSDLPFGTLVQPFNIVGTIDSGYLSYYAQGKWLFIAAMILFLVGSFVFALFTYKKSKYKWVNVFVMNIIIYLSIASITHNPIRNPIILFFLFIGLANLSTTLKNTKYRKPSRTA